MTTTNQILRDALAPIDAVILLRSAIQLHQECDFNSDHPALAEAMRRTAALAAADADQAPDDLHACANCLRPKCEHNGKLCPSPYTTWWSAWDYVHQPMPEYPEYAARPAPVGAVQAPDVMRAISDAHDLAMKQAVQARIPECGDFGAIAQNLSFALAQWAAAPAAPIGEAKPVAWAVVEEGEVSHVTKSKEVAESWLPYSPTKRTLVPLVFGTHHAAEHAKPEPTQQERDHDEGVAKLMASAEHANQSQASWGACRAVAAKVMPTEAQREEMLLERETEHAKPEPAERPRDNEDEHRSFVRWLNLHHPKAQPHLTAWNGWQARGQQAGAVDGAGQDGASKEVVSNSPYAGAAKKAIERFSKGQAETFKAPVGRTKFSNKGDDV